jgi:hypothetical protein
MADVSDRFDTKWECYPKTVRVVGNASDITRTLHINISSEYEVGGIEEDSSTESISEFIFQRDYSDTYQHEILMKRPVIEDLTLGTTVYDAGDTAETWNGDVAEDILEERGATLLFADLRYKTFETGATATKNTTTFSGSNTQPMGEQLLFIGTGFMGNIFVDDVIVYETAATKSDENSYMDSDGIWWEETEQTTDPQLAYTTDNSGSGPTGDYYWGQYVAVKDTTPEPNLTIKYERNDGWLAYPLVWAPTWLYSGSPVIPEYADLFKTYYVQAGDWTENLIPLANTAVFLGSHAVDRNGNVFVSKLVDGTVTNSLTDGILPELFPVDGTGLKFYPIAPL